MTLRCIRVAFASHSRRIASIARHQSLTASLNEKMTQAKQLEQFLYSLPDTNQDGLITRFEVSQNGPRGVRKGVRCEATIESKARREEMEGGEATRDPILGKGETHE